MSFERPFEKSLDLTWQQAGNMKKSRLVKYKYKKR